jgi:THO complex subunit 5
MLPAEDFIAQHQEHTSSSEHDLTIARIQDEHTARQELEVQRQALQKRKDVLLKETNAKKEELSKLDVEIEKWLTGESNVRKILDAREKKAQLAAEKAG